MIWVFSCHVLYIQLFLCHQRSWRHIGVALARFVVVVVVVSRRRREAFFLLIFGYILKSTNHKSIKFGILVCIIKTQIPIAWCQYDKHPKVHRTPHRCSYFLWAILNKDASIRLKFGNMVKEHCRFVLFASWRFAPNFKVPKAPFSILGGHLQVQTIYSILK